MGLQEFQACISGYPNLVKIDLPPGGFTTTPHAAKHEKSGATMFRIMVQSNKIHHEFLLRAFRRKPIGIGRNMLLDWIGIGLR